MDTCGLSQVSGSSVDGFRGEGCAYGKAEALTMKVMASRSRGMVAVTVTVTVTKERERRGRETVWQSPWGE